MDLISTNVDQRIELLQRIPLFASLSKSQLQRLANLFHDVVYPEHQIIVRENESIDSVYILVEGKAEVSQQIKVKTRFKNEAIAILYPGESIGLSDTGFFSTTGLRTATVTALTPVFTIRLELKNLKNFLSALPVTSSGLGGIASLKQLTVKILRQNFIKKIEPFVNIPHSVIEEMSNRIQEHQSPAGTILFNQGDEATCCYLLYLGKVQVLVSRSDGSKKIVAELGPGSIFGELALFTKSKRNATVKTITNCKFLILTRVEFAELIEHSPSSFDALTSMMMDRFRPKQVDEVTVHSRQNAENETIIILKNHQTHNYFKTSPNGLFIWNLLDGDHTIQDIAVTYYYKFNVIATEEIGQFLFRLLQAEFVQKPALAAYIKQPQLPFWIRLLSRIRITLTYEFSIKNMDPLITRLYQRVGYLFFTPVAKVLMSLIAIMGFIVFFAIASHIGSIIRSTPNAWKLLVYTNFTNILIVIFHELAHALTTKSYGFQVHRWGVGWFWLGPMAFTDTSDMWLSTRGPRIAVNLAGIYCNAVMSGIFAVLAWWVSYPEIAAFFWLSAYSSYLIAFYNLNTMYELDGYYVLIDVLDTSNLRTKAMQWLLNDFKKTLFSRQMARKYLPEIIYWIASIIFLFSIACLAYFTQHYVLINFLSEPVAEVLSSHHYRWVLTIFFLTLSFAALYSRLKRAKYLYHKGK